MNREDDMNRTQDHDCGTDVAAYALHALDPGEADTFERHLEQCAICRDELIAFRSVVDALPMTVPAAAAPRKLKRHVMAAIAAEPKRAPAPRSRRAWLPQFAIASPRLGMALAAIVAVVVIAGALVIPATVARMLTNSFARMLWLSTGIGAACGFVGMIVSYHLDISSGATIVLVGATLFGLVFAVTGRRGLKRANGLDAHDAPVVAAAAVGSRA